MITPEQILERGLREQLIYHRMQDGKLFESPESLKSEVKLAFTNN